MRNITRRIPFEVNSIADKVYYAMPRSLFDWKRKVVMALLPDALREYPATKIAGLDDAIITNVTVSFDELAVGSEPTIKLEYEEK